MPRKPRRLPDYFTPEEAAALVEAAPSYPVRMAMRIMLRTGLRVSECLSLCAADLRLSHNPPIISLRAGVRGNKAKKGREIPIPADLVESLRDLASIHGRERRRLLLGISRQAVSGGMKKAAEEAGIDPERAHPHALRHTYGRNAVLNGVPTPVLQAWLGHSTLKETERYVELAGAHHSGWNGSSLAEGNRMIDNRTFEEIIAALVQPVYVEDKSDQEAVGMALYKALRERVPKAGMTVHVTEVKSVGGVLTCEVLIPLGRDAPDDYEDGAVGRTGVAGIGKGDDPWLCQTVAMRRALEAFGVPWKPSGLRWSRANRSRPRSLPRN